MPRMRGRKSKTSESKEEVPDVKQESLVSSNEVKEEVANKENGTVEMGEQGESADQDDSIVIQEDAEVMEVGRDEAQKTVDNSAEQEGAVTTLVPEIPKEEEEVIVRYKPHCIADFSNPVMLEKWEWHMKIFPIDQADIRSCVLDSVSKIAQETWMYIDKQNYGMGSFDLCMRNCNDALVVMSKLLHMPLTYRYVTVFVTRRSKKIEPGKQKTDTAEDDDEEEEDIPYTVIEEQASILLDYVHTPTFERIKGKEMKRSLYVKYLPDNTSKELLRVLFPTANNLDILTTQKGRRYGDLNISTASNVMGLCSACVTIEINGKRDITLDWKEENLDDGITQKRAVEELPWEIIPRYQEYEYEAVPEMMEDETTRFQRKRRDYSEMRWKAMHKTSRWDHNSEDRGEEGSQGEAAAQGDIGEPNKRKDGDRNRKDGRDERRRDKGRPDSRRDRIRDLDRDRIRRDSGGFGPPRDDRRGRFLDRWDDRFDPMARRGFYEPERFGFPGPGRFEAMGPGGFNGFGYDGFDPFGRGGRFDRGRGGRFDGRGGGFGFGRGGRFDDREMVTRFDGLGRGGRFDGGMQGGRFDGGIQVGRFDTSDKGRFDNQNVGGGRFDKDSNKTPKPNVDATKTISPRVRSVDSPGSSMGSAGRGGFEKPGRGSSFANRGRGFNSGGGVNRGNRIGTTGVSTQNKFGNQQNSNFGNQNNRNQQQPRNFGNPASSYDNQNTGFGVQQQQFGTQQQSVTNANFGDQQNYSGQQGQQQSYNTQQNDSTAQQNMGMQQSYGNDSSQQQNYSTQQQSYITQQNYGDNTQNYGDNAQNYGDNTQNYSTQQNYGNQVQNYNTQQPNYNTLQQNYSSEQQNYNTTQQQPQNYSSQQPSYNAGQQISYNNQQQPQQPGYDVTQQPSTYTTQDGFNSQPASSYDQTAYNSANMAGGYWGQANYTSTEQNYGTPAGFGQQQDQSAYSTNQSTYDTSQATYNTNQPTYSTNQPTYSTNQPTYSTNQPTYSTNQPTYSTNQNFSSTAGTGYSADAAYASQGLYAASSQPTDTGYGAAFATQTGVTQPTTAYNFAQYPSNS